MDRPKAEENKDEEDGEKGCVCAVNRSLLPLKIFNFFYFGAVGSVIPYLTVYLQQLRVTAPETGVITGVSVLVAFLVRPVLGVLADFFRARRLLLSICCLLFGATFCSLWFVPSRSSSSLSNSAFQCTQTGNQDQCSSLFFNSSTDSNAMCVIPSRTSTNANTHTNSNDVHATESSTPCSVLEIHLNANGSTDDLCPTPCVKLYPEGYFTIFFNDSLLKTLSLKFQEEASRGYVDLTCFINVSDLDEVRDVIYTVGVKNATADSSFSNQDTNGERRNVSSHSNTSLQLHIPPQQRFPNPTSSFPRVHLHSQALGNVQCSFSCVRDNDATQSPAFSFDLTFGLSLTLICIARAFYSSSGSLLDAVTYGFLGSNRHLWGRQRMWGTLGTATVATVFTVINDRLAGGGFSVQFATCCSLTVLACVTTFFLGARGAKPPTSNTHKPTPLIRPNVLRDLRGLLRETAVKIFLLKLLVLGMFSGSVQNFMFWFLRELGSGQTILGACLLANCVSAVVMLRFSAVVMQRLGETRTMYLALPAYFIRFVGASLIQTPWLALPLELFHGVTYSLLWASASASTHLLAPYSSRATCQAIAGAVYWDMGRGLGSFVTGQLFRAVGARWTFRGYGVLAVLLLPLCCLVDRHWPLPSAQRQDAASSQTPDGATVHEDEEKEEDVMQALPMTSTEIASSVTLSPACETADPGNHTTTNTDSETIKL